MAGIVEDVAARMIGHALQEHLERRAVMQVLAWMQLVAQIDTYCIEPIEDGTPALCKLSESSLDQSDRPLRPG
jgi:hypothetical protein